MKKFLALLLTLSTVASISAGCNKDCNTTVKCEPRPKCSRLVTKEVFAPARKVCETNCHYECPANCTRTEGQE
ncbi:MAG: hypothetical protein P4L22_02630 [Candidatus Babeliales bacterium]|nr:hypothetical protein [Candidatus Babeliales bacterium]